MNAVQAAVALVAAMLVWSEGAANAVTAAAIPPCSVTGPEYYAFRLIPTRRVPGTARAVGIARVSFPRSPFGVSIAPDGSYRYDLEIDFEGLRPRRSGVYTAWVMKTDLSGVTRLGVVEGDAPVRGSVEWNQFIVAVTLEESDDTDAKEWKGPVALRGISRSGLMHTMAGHGPFEQELCAKYGFGN